MSTSIILVDDEKAVRDSTAQSLLLAGFDVQTFESAQTVLMHTQLLFYRQFVLLLSKALPMKRLLFWED